MKKKKKVTREEEIYDSICGTWWSRAFRLIKYASKINFLGGMVEMELSHPRKTKTYLLYEVAPKPKDPRFYEIIGDLEDAEDHAREIERGREDMERLELFKASGLPKLSEADKKALGIR